MESPFFSDDGKFDATARGKREHLTMPRIPQVPEPPTLVSPPQKYEGAIEDGFMSAYFHTPASLSKLHFHVQPHYMECSVSEGDHDDRPLNLLSH